MTKESRSARELAEVVDAVVDGLIIATIEDCEKAIAGVPLSKAAKGSKAK